MSDREPCAKCDGTGFQEGVPGIAHLCLTCHGLGVCPTCRGLLAVCDVTDWNGDPETAPESHDCPCQVPA